MNGALIVGVNAQHHQALKVNKTKKRKRAICRSHMLRLSSDEFLKTVVVEFPNFIQPKMLTLRHFPSVLLCFGFKGG